MEIEVKILSGDKKELENELNKYLNKGFEIKGSLIHAFGNHFHVLITRKSI